jgi:purine-nucleoside phosphorylase
MNQQQPAIIAKRLKRISRLRPRLAMVLGSGFHHVISDMDVEAEIAYARLPGFPLAGVKGHAGRLLVGKLGGALVMVLSGRSHFYEGHSMSQVTCAVRALAAYGVTDLLLTNAAGGVNRRFVAGDFMMLTDHINLMGSNPLRGDEWPGLPRFVDLTCAYDKNLRNMLRQAARVSRIKLREGVYLAVGGPSYETPAEIRAFSRLGADAVGMSTVPEAIVARQCGLRVAGVSCITNLAAGVNGQPLSHAEVLETAERVRVKGAKFLSTFAKIYAEKQ